LARTLACPEPLLQEKGVSAFLDAPPPAGLWPGESAVTEADPRLWPPPRPWERAAVASLGPHPGAPSGLPLPPPGRRHLLDALVGMLCAPSSPLGSH